MTSFAINDDLHEPDYEIMINYILNLLSKLLKTIEPIKHTQVQNTLEQSKK